MEGDLVQAAFLCCSASEFLFDSLHKFLEPSLSQYSLKVSTETAREQNNLRQQQERE